MAIEIRMPRLGWTMEEGAFGEWLKADGDTIQPGDLLYTVESDKATQEVEALDPGILQIDPAGPQSGDMVTVGTLLAYLTKAGEAVTFAQSAPSLPTQRENAQPTVASEQSPSAPAQPATRNGPTISPRARRVATELGVDWMHLAGSGRTGRIVEADIRAAANLQTEMAVAVRATPVAVRMAAEAGIDLAALAAEKPGDRIGRAEVEAAIAMQQAGAETGQPAPTIKPSTTSTSRPISTSRSTSGTERERIPVSRMRHLIAQRMSESAHTTAAVTLTTEADATELVALRTQLKATFAPRGEAVPTYNDLLIKLTAVALAEHPLLRALWQDDEITIAPGIHIGLAVDTDEGLLVPVVRDVQNRRLRQIASTTKTLIEQAQARKIGPDALQGGNFTITNLGMYNIDGFTPLINLPQCAILGVGRIIEKPAVHNGQVVPRSMVTLSLTFDHRIVDGAPAARFLDSVRGYVETPLLWLVS